MIRLLWGFLTFCAGVLWLKVTHNVWLQATVTLHHQHLEIETSLWIVLIALFVMFVLLSTVMAGWYRLMVWMRSGRVGRALKTQKHWEALVQPFLMGDMTQVMRVLDRLTKRQSASADTAKLLSAWLKGLLYASEVHVLDACHFKHQDWAKLQAPKAMQLQWHGQYEAAHAIWQHMFQQAPQSALFLKMWLQCVMASGMKGEGLRSVCQVFNRHRGVMSKHYPDFSQTFSMHVFKHSDADVASTMTVWKAMPKADRKVPAIQKAYVGVLLRHDEVAEAVKYLEQMIPKDWDHGLCALYAMTPGDAQAQIKTLNRWLKYGPDHCHDAFYQGLAYAYARCGLWTQTLEMLQHLDGQVLDAPWHQLLILSHMALRQFESAMHCLRAHTILQGLQWPDASH